VACNLMFISYLCKNNMRPSLREQPNQFIPENVKNQVWFIENARYVASKYNTQMNSLGYRTDQTFDKPVDEMLRMFSYYLGKQENRDYYYTTQDQDSCALPNVWINGQKLTSMIDFMLGTAMKMIENVEPSTKAISKAAINKRTRDMELALIKVEFKNIFDQMEKEFGVSVNPLGKQDFELPEEVAKYMQLDYKQYGEEIAYAMVMDILHRNKFINKYKQAFFYTLLGGVIGIENKIINKKQVKNVILPYNLIWDNTFDDDFNENARFVGKVDWVTPGEIISNPYYTRQLTDQEIQEIKTLTPDNIDKLLGEDNITTNKLKWYWNNNGVPSLAATTCYWIGYKELRYEKTKDKYGNTHLGKIKGAATSEYWVKTVYKATLLANKYVVDFGEVPNIVRKQDDINSVELPITVFIPNMVMGESRSVASRLHKHQDKIDFLNNEITKMVTRAKGKVFVLNKHKLGTATAKEVLNDFERLGIHITDGTATGEDMLQTDSSKVVEVVDMTLDPNVQQILALKREEERIMEEIVNIPKIAMGQQQGYVGAKTQAGTIAQSNIGTAYLYQGFIQFIERDLQFSLNQYKVSLLANQDDEIPVVGDRGMNYLKVTDEFKFEDFGIYVKVKDFIDDQAKERLLFIAQAAMQNQAIDMLDYLTIETCKTYTELYNHLKYSIEKKQRKAEEQMQLQQMMQQAQIEQQAQLQQDAMAAQQEGENYRTELKAGADLVKTAPAEAPPSAPSEMPA
jgi:hypothetical protein